MGCKHVEVLDDLGEEVVGVVLRGGVDGEVVDAVAGVTADLERRADVKRHVERDQRGVLGEVDEEVVFGSREGAEDLLFRSGEQGTDLLLGGNGEDIDLPWGGGVAVVGELAGERRDVATIVENGDTLHLLPARHHDTTGRLMLQYVVEYMLFYCHRQAVIMRG